ncbi:MAG: hypothetical protein JWQ81_7832 [Amycolatopsis sp.]|uniref:STAS domain-containing protein n=1 Tax=Amycolatopsis sp. TaxID=37632 RepID=UPI0026242325|nr:STAS domain-containing protein [Amycolatopsis sp.]MCU1687093.1 hypothetical protein [Amycolatopsis sp.]
MTALPVIAPVGVVPQARASAESTRAPADQMWVSVHRPTQVSVIVTIGGEVDMLTAPRLSELVTCRLRAAVSVVVIDLSEVTFLGVAGVRVLHQAYLLARQSAVQLFIVTGDSRCAARALRICGMEHLLSRPR